ncbi:DUF1329 domain-containing protein [Halieaceae bacterium IMCC8485]|jgi:hypothetical protein|uniref:DUF1329 domain-containing protein n=1 Tax=Candidatus Seongchinamella marina TaxID=2518990 RepID=A0ABT3SSC1_9GAMM|nr:DUF1329 domain-containing protein [Candidatus Seongchinamella marina]MCX2972881.1 DUF1329 domain-containing protein [Candidatus Seongchinamella marina]
MMYKKTLAALCFSSLVTSTALASVSTEEAARLGVDLTPMGAEAGPNADGSIPAWNPAGTPIPPDFVAGSDNYVDAYPGEEPLYTIDGSNYQEYAEVLTEGSKAMFEKLGADGFKMNVYPTKRDFVVPEWVYSNTAKNATGATLEDGGQRIANAYPGVPFPLPQSGLEVLWNHLTRYLSDHTVKYDTYYVSSNGKPILSTTGLMGNVLPMYKSPESIMDDTPWLKLRINYKAPARRAGEILLVHEPGADFTQGKGRKAWQYLTGQRRVRLAPAVNFDTPNPGVAGTSTYDDSFIINGSPERFDWKLVGKKEMIVPYSSYDFVFQRELKDTLGEKFIDPEVVRWEKHRMWIIEATLKEGNRHLYSKRRFYIDEDSWAGLAAENYDGQGNMWRVQFAYGANLYDIKSNYHFAYGAYDLVQGIYNLNTKPSPGGFKNGVDQKDSWFSPKGMARGGVR